MNTYNDLLRTTERNLSASRFRISRDISLANGMTCDLAASRMSFSWKGLVILSQHLLLRHAPTATPADFYAFFDDGFRYAKRANRLPLFRGLQFGYMVVPFIAVDAATPELITFVSSRPRRHWALFEFPVLHDLSTGRTHYFDETAVWGAAFFSEMRDMIHAAQGVKGDVAEKIAA